MITFDGIEYNGYLFKSFLIPDKNIVFVLQTGAPLRERYYYMEIIDAIAESFQIILYE